MQLIPQSDFAKQLFELGAGTATDKAVSKAVMMAVNNLLPAATNVPGPTAPELDITQVDHKAGTKKSLGDVQQLMSTQGAGSISLALLGETHNDAKDQARANAFIADINRAALTPSMVVYERGLPYAVPNTGVPVVREANLTTVALGDFSIINGLSAAQRSMIVAGYLVLCLGGGDQSQADKLLLFYGANHSDILTRYFSYFARHTNASHLLKRPCTAMSIRSHQA